MDKHHRRLSEEEYFKIEGKVPEGELSQYKIPSEVFARLTKTEDKRQEGTEFNGNKVQQWFHRQYHTIGTFINRHKNISNLIERLHLGSAQRKVLKNTLRFATKEGYELNEYQGNINIIRREEIDGNLIVHGKIKKNDVGTLLFYFKKDQTMFTDFPSFMVGQTLKHVDKGMYQENRSDPCWYLMEIFIV